MKAGSIINKSRPTIATLIEGITVEPIIFMHGLTLAFAIVITPTLYYEKICKVGSYWFGNGTTFSDEICDHLDNGNHTEEQEYVQRVYSELILVSRYCQAIVPLLIILMVGPWSDKAGRRPLILIPLLGYIFNDLQLLMNVIFFDELKVEFLMLDVFQVFLGGGSLFYLGW